MLLTEAFLGVDEALLPALLLIGAREQNGQRLHTFAVSNCCE